jgi:hypothetical protein
LLFPSISAQNDFSVLDPAFPIHSPMDAVLAAIAGAAFTAFSCQTLGLCIVRKLAMPISRLEEYLFAFFAGAATFSLLIFTLLVVHAGYTVAVVATGLGCIALWVFRFRGKQAYTPMPGRVPKLWLLFALALCARFTLLYLSRAIGPEYSPDGSTYHLALVYEYFRKAHFPVITTNMYASFPAGLEMLFFAAFSIGRHSAAAPVHLCFLFAEAAALVLFGLRFQAAKAAVGAMALFYMMPIVGYDASVAYNDVALSAAGFAMFYALQLWSAQKDNNRLLILAGLFAGFAGAIKYTGFFAPLFAIGYVLYAGRRRPEGWKVRLALVSLPAVLLIAPWLVKNTVEVHNPVSPFANRLFPNPYVHISFEEEYRANLAHYNQTDRTEIPLEVAFNGAKLQGLIGPVFLLLPLALFALTSPLGRRLLFAGLFFLLPYFGNIGTRFLIPAMPFLALALCMVLESWRACLLPVVVLQFLVSWPGITKIYAPLAMGLDVPHWDESLREVSEEWTLRHRLPGFAMAEYIDTHLPLSARLLEFGGLPGSYMRQQVDDFYEGAQNQKASHLLWMGAYPETRPTERHTFQFSVHQLQCVRIEQTANDKREVWQVAEIRFFLNGQEVVADSKWKLSSKPNPGDVRLVFDGNPATMWQSWEGLRRGMYLEARFQKPISIDRVEVDSPADQDNVRMIVRGEAAGKGTMTLADESATEHVASPPDFRKKATSALRHMGYTHVVLRSNQFCYPQVHSDPRGWGMTLVAERGEYALFALDKPSPR